MFPVPQRYFHTPYKPKPRFNTLPHTTIPDPVSGKSNRSVFLAAQIQSTAINLGSVIQPRQVLLAKCPRIRFTSQFPRAPFMGCFLASKLALSKSFRGLLLLQEDGPMCHTAVCRAHAVQTSPLYLSCLLQPHWTLGAPSTPSPSLVYLRVFVFVALPHLKRRPPDFYLVLRKSHPSQVSGQV